MTTHTISLGETHQFSPIFLDYLQNDSALKPFFGLYPSLENFEAQIRQKQFPAEHRSVLHRVLEQQYQSIDRKPNLAILKDSNTFTVTTGHQLNLFTGPLYVIYKLITTVNLAGKLKEQYPQYNFVPVYWMATEDHDLAEINHFHLFGKKYAWETEQTGAVGRMHLAGMEPLFESLPEKVELFERAYLQHRNLADATRCFANDLFGEDGLICVDADDAQLKALFRHVVLDDLTQHTAFRTVKQASVALEELGYKTQVNAREINLFYLDQDTRARIVQEDGHYKVLNTDENGISLKFPEHEAEALLERSPEKFSPNVILRPLYQETILPNLAYIGGPAEVAYWLQLKSTFDHYRIPFPILMPRNFAMVISKANAKKIQKLNLAVEDLFLDEVSLKRHFLEKNTETVELGQETTLLNQVFDAILAKALPLDRTLEGFVMAEKQKALKSVENIEKRLKKAEEKNQETEINQVIGLKAKLFPNGGLQERTDNYLNFALNNPDFISQVKAVFDPLNFRFYLLNEE